MPIVISGYPSSYRRTLLNYHHASLASSSLVDYLRTYIPTYPAGRTPLVLLATLANYVMHSLSKGHLRAVCNLSSVVIVPLWVKPGGAALLHCSVLAHHQTSYKVSRVMSRQPRWSKRRSRTHSLASRLRYIILGCIQHVSGLSLLRSTPLS